MLPRAGWVATNARLKIALHFGLPSAYADYRHGRPPLCAAR